MTGNTAPAVRRRQEPLASIWARRALSLPLYLGLALLCLAGAPLWVLLTAAADLARSRTDAVPDRE